MACFKIGINMAGAISAGAYTAGVIDFLIEALDEWYKAKARGEVVPEHDVCIEVVSGASAGGMCAAISVVMLQEHFDHIHDTKRTVTNNRAYESWVNRIDIRDLLGTADLDNTSRVVSLLDSTPIEKIATDALTPGTPLHIRRPYVSPTLALFLSLTNLRGIPYSLNGAAPGSIEESASFFGDRIQFRILPPGTSALPGTRVHTLDFTKPGAEGGWEVLQAAAMATGAFPVFLAPRILERRLSEYTPPMWESVMSAATGTPPPVKPNFPPDTPDPLQTLNVDGGVTNDDPFNYAHDYLAQLEPPIADVKAASSAMNADRAVIGIAPFPTTDKFDVTYQPFKNCGIFFVFGRLFSALLSQSRFFGESLDQVMNGATFNRFVIAPSDPELVLQHEATPGKAQPAALQCATVGAFGGFFDRGFRAHDYALGRRNCQMFLSHSFVLPVDNVVIKAGLDGLDAERRKEVIKRFRRSAPGTYAHRKETLEQMGCSLPLAQTAAPDDWFPVVPLCTDALREEVPRPNRVQMSRAGVNRVVDLTLRRFKAVMSLLLSSVPSRALRSFLILGQPVIRVLARRPLRKTLVKQLGDSYKP